MIICNQPFKSAQCSAPHLNMIPGKSKFIAPAYSMPAASQSSHPGAFALGTLIIFFLFSHISEFVDTTGRLHLVLIMGILGAGAAALSGLIPKITVTPQGAWLTLFTIWIAGSIPFSQWRGQSFRQFSGTWLKSYIVFFLVAGLIFSVQQCRKTILWLALSTLSVIYYAFRAGSNNVDDDRLSATYGTFGNANDLATTLLVGLPFLLYVVADEKRNKIVRAGCAGLTLVLLLVVFRTGSRGALVAIGILLLLGFVKAKAVNKLKILILAVIMAVLFPLVVSKSLMQRYGTILKSNPGAAVSAEAASAMDSTNARRELMKHGLILTARHPLFGVGLGNFSDQSASLFIERGQPALWFTCHDIFLLVSSETGIPGLIMFAAAIAVCYKTLFSLQKRARNIKELEDIGNLAFCILMSLTAYVACGVFSTSAYGVQLPLLAGLTAALARVSRPAIDAAYARLPQPVAFAAPSFPRSASRIAPATSAAFRV